MNPWNEKSEIEATGSRRQQQSQTRDDHTAAIRSFISSSCRNCIASSYLNSCSRTGSIVSTHHPLTKSKCSPTESFKNHFSLLLSPRCSSRSVEA